jgi:WD40 repeat protein
MRYRLSFIIEVVAAVLVASFAMAQTPPVISNVQVPRVTGYDAMITWETDVASSSEVRYGQSANALTDIVTQDDLVTTHQIGLADLEPETTYFFEVVSRDAGGTENVDSRGGLFYYFKTTDFNPRVIAVDTYWLYERILEYDPSIGSSQVLVDYIGPSPRGVAIDVDGNLYFSISQYGRIYKTDSHGENISVIPPWSEYYISQAKGLAFNSDGNVLVAAGTSEILEYTRTGKFVRTFADYLDGINSPYFIAVNQLGHVFVSQGYVVLEFDPDGNLIGTFASGMYLARGLAFDREGNLYVGYADGIRVFDSAGMLLKDLRGENYLGDVWGIALLPNGNLLVCNGESDKETLCVLDSQGNLVKRKGAQSKYDWLDFPLYEPYDVAVYGGVDLTFTRGYVLLDREIYNCAQRVGITLADADLKGAGTANVSIKSNTEPVPESVTLYEEANQPGVFRGWILTATGAPAQDGLLQVSGSDAIQVEYLDLDDGKGSSRLAHATASAGCEVPQVSNVHVANLGEHEATISWQTDDPSDSVVYYGLSQLAVTESAYLGAATYWHSIDLAHLQSNTVYYYSVASNDASGAVGSADNDGNLFTFITSLGIDKFFDDVEEPVQGWIAEGSWARTTEQAHSPSYAWSDSPGGDYANNANAALISPLLYVDDLITKELSFYHHYELEYGFDYGYVEISKDNGQTWSLPIYTVTGSNSGLFWIFPDIKRRS